MQGADGQLSYKYLYLGIDFEGTLRKGLEHIFVAIS
jgi:hypothetical protein